MQRRQLLRREAAVLDSAAPRPPHSVPQGFFAFQAQGPGAGPRVGGSELSLGVRSVWVGNVGVSG